VLLVAASAFAGTAPVLLIGDEPGSWTNILGAVGFPLTQASHVPAEALVNQVEKGAVVVLQGAGEHAAAFGIVPTERRVLVRGVTDRHNPELRIVWEKPLELPVYTMPAEAQLFTWERWERAPLVAGLRRGRGAVLWLAVPPGHRGYERFPYLLQALCDLGLIPPLRSNRIWAFFDGSYRLRVDLDYFATRWREAGISALHVAAWHYFERDDTRDAYLRKLIEACHREGIHVYAWLELPHVSERFWQAHPEWREKTAIGQDAQLDWRKLMNLQNRECRRAVAEGVHALLRSFDWDGVNLAELYFESLEGAANPARFTPMNAEIRAEYKTLSGVDPATLFQQGTPAASMQEFLQYRAGVVRRMQAEWLAEVEAARKQKPHLDVVLTHVDDRFDGNMREMIGADAEGVLPLLDRYDFTFLIEDPATVWHLGPDRYPKIAERYAPITKRRDKLAIDINIVERYQDVYPTKQQTGTELFQLLHLAATSFPRVALYFENSILKPDQPLLPAAAAAVRRFEPAGDKVVVDSEHGVGVNWTGPVLVNGRPWPVTDGQTVWLPPGLQVLQPAAEPGSTLAVTHFNGGLRTAAPLKDGVELSYSSEARPLVRLSRRPASIEVDGSAADLTFVAGDVVALPRGQHVVVIR
jgi:hypothetical protein